MAGVSEEAERQSSGPPAEAGRGIVKCERCPSWKRSDVEGPHAPRWADGPPGVGPILVDCAGEEIQGSRLP